MSLIQGHSYYHLSNTQHDTLLSLIDDLDPTGAIFNKLDWFQVNGEWYADAENISFDEQSNLVAWGLPSDAFLYLQSTQWAG